MEFKEITTKQGRLKGVVKKSAGLVKTTYYSFRGIPYAKPPVGELRFKTAEPYGQWEGVREASKEGNDPIQRHLLFGYQTGDEDCLYLNVYTTQPEEGAKKAVMVWIHGGGFVSGSGSCELYGPDFLIEKDIVLVTINYRCGVLGFLSLESDKLPGNLGLKDQVLALQWVQDNIHSFGGDPKNVTIFGESAGAASVQYHLLSPLSRGLFHKAILQSGTALAQCALQDKPREKAFLLARALGCFSQDPDTVLEFLMTLPASDLMNVQKHESFCSKKEKIQNLSCVFAPCIEIAGDTPFLPDYPRKILERGKFSKVPIIIGLTDKEGLFLYSIPHIKWEEMINSNPTVVVPGNLDIAAGSEEEDKLSKEILHFYSSRGTLTWDITPDCIDFLGDILITIELESSRQYFLDNEVPVYTYLFSYTSPRSLSSSLLPQTVPDKAAQLICTGASHADELGFLFKSNMSHIPFTPPTAEDEALMTNLLQAWTTFAKTGNPNSEEPEIIWQEDSVQNPCYMDIGQDWKMVNGSLFPKRVEFWKKIYKKYSYLY